MTTAGGVSAEAFRQLEKELIDARLELARLDERVKASDRALDISRSELERAQTNYRALVDQVRAMEDHSSQDTGRGTALNSVWLVTVAVIGLAIGVASIVARLLK